MDPLSHNEYRPGSSAVLSDRERWPTLTDEGAIRLERWRAHPDAPIWVHATGDRLTADQIERVREPLGCDGWLDGHLENARRMVRYRRNPGLNSLSDFPLIERRDLIADLASFIPLGADLDRMVGGTSSGSTGAALVIPDDLEEVARGFHLLRGLVTARGITWEPDGERLALAHLVHQRQAFTYVSIMSSFAQSAMVRVNLEHSGWPTVTSRARFLADANPQVISGNPSSLNELLAGDLVGIVRPLAIFSGAMALSAPLRAALEEAFTAPVFDIYGLHETRPIAVRTDDGPFRVLDRRVLVETLDTHGMPVPEGEIGELVVTAGENPLLPLVRYRTGDFGRLIALPDGGVGIADLEGRDHTRFVAADGRMVACVDLTQQLQVHGALGWSIRQHVDGSITARIAGGDCDAVHAALRALLGQEVTVKAVERVAQLGEGKPRRFRSAAVASG
ncbi:MAG: CoF synthetase [Microbacteriaceae bacterium]|nr:CoF synthetase [Microbacteriaceae bacterium]